jgi:hypothetical protein
MGHVQKFLWQFPLTIRSQYKAVAEESRRDKLDAPMGLKDDRKSTAFKTEREPFTRVDPRCVLQQQPLIIF